MSWRTEGFLCAGVALAVAGLVPPTMAADGVAISVKQAADVNRQAGQRPLQEQDPVFMGDVIKTNRIGGAQIRLSDNTKLAVGPNSLITIDRFVLDTETTAQQVSLNAVRGAFRFITGDSRKDAYTITTPTATIGVRGTMLDVSILPTATKVAVFDGEADTCKRLRRDECVRAITRCGVAVIPATEPVRRVDDDEERIETLVEDFPLVVDQRPLAAEFHTDAGSCGVTAAAIRKARIKAKLEIDPPTPPESNGDPGITTASVPTCNRC